MRICSRRNVLECASSSLCEKVRTFVSLCDYLHVHAFIRVNVYVHTCKCVPVYELHECK